MDGCGEALLPPCSDGIGCDVFAHARVPMQSGPEYAQTVADSEVTRYIRNSFHGNSLAVPAVCLSVTRMLWSLGWGGDGLMSWIGGTGP